MKKKSFESNILSVFETEEVSLNNSQKKIITINAPNWVNIIPITHEKKIVFVEQHRYGVNKKTLEIPGGMVDPGETPLEAVNRELLEETGYSSKEVTKLGVLSPNPALFTNNVFSYLAINTNKNNIKISAEENINVHLIPVEEISELILKGKIDHALVVAAFYLFLNRNQNAHNA